MPIIKLTETFDVTIPNKSGRTYTVNDLPATFEEFLAHYNTAWELGVLYENGALPNTNIYTHRWMCDTEGVEEEFKRLMA